MPAWPALITHLYDGWIQGIFDGYTKKANSISPLYTSAGNPNDKISYSQSFYASLKWNGTLFMNKLEAL